MSVEKFQVRKICYGKEDQEGRSRLFGRAGYLHHHPVAQRELRQLRSHRRFGRRRAGDGAGRAGREGEKDGRVQAVCARSQKGVRGGLHLPDHAGGRGV